MEIIRNKHAHQIMKSRRKQSKTKLPSQKTWKKRVKYIEYMGSSCQNCEIRLGWLIVSITSVFSWDVLLSASQWLSVQLGCMHWLQSNSQACASMVLDKWTEQSDHEDFLRDQMRKSLSSELSRCFTMPGFAFAFLGSSSSESFTMTGFGFSFALLGLLSSESRCFTTSGFFGFLGSSLSSKSMTGFTFGFFTFFGFDFGVSSFVSSTMTGFFFCLHFTVFPACPRATYPGWSNASSVCLWAPWGPSKRVDKVDHPWPPSLWDPLSLFPPALHRVLFEFFWGLTDSPRAFLLLTKCRQLPAPCCPNSCCWYRKVVPWWKLDLFFFATTCWGLLFPFFPWASLFSLSLSWWSLRHHQGFVASSPSCGTRLACLLWGFATSSPCCDANCSPCLICLLWGFATSSPSCDMTHSLRLACLPLFSSAVTFDMVLKDNEGVQSYAWHCLRCSKWNKSIVPKNIVLSQLEESSHMVSRLCRHCPWTACSRRSSTWHLPLWCAQLHWPTGCAVALLDNSLSSSSNKFSPNQL